MQLSNSFVVITIIIIVFIVWSEEVPRELCVCALNSCICIVYWHVMNEVHLVKIINISHGDVKSASHIYPHKIYICWLHLSSSSFRFWFLIIHSRWEHGASDKARTSSLCVTHTHTHTHKPVNIVTRVAANVTSFRLSQTAAFCILILWAVKWYTRCGSGPVIWRRLHDI